MCALLLLQQFRPREAAHGSAVGLGSLAKVQMPEFGDLGCGLVGAHTDRLTTVITRAFARHDKSPSVPLVPRCGVFDDCLSVSPFT